MSELFSGSLYSDHAYRVLREGEPNTLLISPPPETFGPLPLNEWTLSLVYICSRVLDGGMVEWETLN